MGTLDTLLFVFFGLVALSALVASILCFRRAFRVSGQRDGDLKMFAWAVGGMTGLVIAGMSAAYILLPILLHK